MIIRYGKSYLKSVKADFHLSFRLPPRQDFRVEESSTLSAKPFSAAGDCATLRHQRKSCRGGRRKLKWKSALTVKNDRRRKWR